MFNSRKIDYGTKKVAIARRFMRLSQNSIQPVRFNIVAMSLAVAVWLADQRDTKTVPVAHLLRL